MDNLSFPQLKQFRFYFIIRGIETFELDQAPDGWINTLIEFAVSKNYTALRRSLSTPYKFIGNAGMLCRRESITYSIMADIATRIDMLEQDLSYRTIYSGRLNFADNQGEDSETGYTVPMISNDFSNNIDTYDSVDYSLDLEDGISLELTPISLNETATFISILPTGIGQDYFPPFQVINNQQNSIDPSVHDSVEYHVTPADIVSWNNYQWCFYSRLTQNLLITGTLAGHLFNPDNRLLKFSLYDQNGVEVKVIFGSTDTGDFTININLSIPVIAGQKLYMYIQDTTRLGGASMGFTSGQLDFSYKTTTPATMCKALTGDQVFAKLLQKMNPNRDSRPNDPVPYQSHLLTTTLANVVYTSSDSIRAAKGSIYKPGNTIGQGIYKVISPEPVTYQGTVYTTGQSFAFIQDTSFSGTGYVQKTQSIYVGNIFSVGDTLVAGGTYLVSGTDPAQYIVYNGKVLIVGTFFDYVLGEDTFTVSDLAVFVQQVAEKAQLIISLSTFFKSVRSEMGGNACMGYLNGVMFMEDLTMCYQPGGKLDLGVVSQEWKRSFATDMMYANFKGGYKDQQYDALNGQQEVNSEVTYTTGLMLNPLPQNGGDLPNMLDLQDPIRKDPYGIESVRITQGDTAASRSNNDTFGIWINPVPVSSVPFDYYHPALAADSLTSITGVDKSYYNFFMSPKQKLLRGAPYLASIFWNMADYPITLASARKNSGMVTIDLNGRKVAEADSVLVSSLGNGLFIPMYFKGPQNIGYAILKQLDANPFKGLNFTVKGVQLKGFIQSFKINPATNEKQDITLLLEWGQDLTPLIGY